MKRVMLLMTTQTYRATEFMEAAGKLGLPVTVGSEQTHLLAAHNPAGHITLDFNDLEQATDDIVAFIEKNPVDAIVATDDDGVMLAAMASEALGLPHSPFNGVAAARNKYVSRQRFAAAGLNSPQFWRFSADADPAQVAQEIAHEGAYPCVVKPLALAASRGVMRANDPLEFEVAFRRLVRILREPELASHPQAADVLVETYIPGEEVALEGILADGVLEVLAIFDKPDPLEGPFFEETIYVTPSRHSQDTQAAIVDTARRACAALGLTSGPVHVELRLNGEGVWMLEIAPRSIGGYCSRALRFGIDTTLEEMILQHALGTTSDPAVPATPASGVMMIPIPQAGELCDVRGIEQAHQVPMIDELRLTRGIGQMVTPPPEGSEYLGFIFARGQTPQEVEAALREAHARLEFEIVSPGENSNAEV